MGRRLAFAVAVHTVTGTVWLHAGESPSSDLAALIRNEDCWEPEAAAPVAAVEEPPRSGRGSSKAAWARYAETVGVTVDDGWDRDQIIEAVDAARG